ncbi:MAG: hypothetical protein ABI456_25780 [Ktedonobacteraceae bacterium]|nr:hypothetical protein [Chloroflexota bacterium]
MALEIYRVLPGAMREPLLHVAHQFYLHAVDQQRAKVNSWQWHRLSVQSIRCKIEEGLGKRMAQIMWTQRRGKFCCLTEFGNDLTNTAFGQGTALTEKEMPIWPATPERNRLTLDSRSLAPAFGHLLAVGEIGIERFTGFLDQRDLAMFESLASTNDEQPAPCGDLHIRRLTDCSLSGILHL